MPHSIPSAVIDRVKDTIRRKVDKGISEPSTLGFIFQARYVCVLLQVYKMK